VRNSRVIQSSALVNRWRQREAVDHRKRKDGRTLPPPLTSRNQARIQVIHVQSHCAARPGTRRNYLRTDVDSGTSLWNANVRVVSTETIPKVLLDISILYDQTPSFLPTFWRGHSMVRQTTPLGLGSLPAPQYTLSTPRRRVQTALGTTS